MALASDSHPTDTCLQLRQALGEREVRRRLNAAHVAELDVCERQTEAAAVVGRVGGVSGR